jgi:ABC transporter substrate binding protein/NMT1-like family
MLQRLLLVALPAAAVLAIFYVVYSLVDPLPPRRLVIGAGIAGSGYDNFARRYARVLARDGIDLEIRNTAGAVENLDLLRDPASKVQAALTTVGFAQPDDSDHLASLGGVFDAPIFVFYKSAERVTQFAQLRGKRLAIGTAGTSIRPLILQVLKAGGAAEAPTRFVDMDYDRAIDALIAGEIDVAIFPSQLDTGLLRRALTAPDVRLMNVAQAEAIAKTVPGIKHVVLWQGLIDLTHDIPDADVNLLASGPKRLELLHELVPTARVVAFLVYPADPVAEQQLRDSQAAAHTLGLELHVLNASTESDFDGVFVNVIQLRAGGLVIAGHAFFNARSEQLAALALRHAVPTVHTYRRFVAAGGLMSYGGSITDSYRVAGVYTGRILKGEKPADLPVQQGTKVELYINLKTAKALGITVPLPLSGRADEVIE